MGALFCQNALLIKLLAQMFFQFLISIPCIGDIILSLEHGRRLVPRELHDHRLVHPRFAHIGVKGVAQIVKPEIDDPDLLARSLEGGFDSGNEPPLKS